MWVAWHTDFWFQFHFQAWKVCCTLGRSLGFSCSHNSQHLHSSKFMCWMFCLMLDQKSIALSSFQRHAVTNSKFNMKYADENTNKKTWWVVIIYGIMSNSVVVVKSTPLTYINSGLMWIWSWTMNSSRQVANIAYAVV